MSLAMIEKLPYKIHVMYSSYEELINVLKENPEIEMFLERMNYGHIAMTSYLSKEDCVLLKLNFSNQQLDFIPWPGHMG